MIIRLKKILIKIIGFFKRKKLTKKDFTIISNNCFGGIIYRNYNIEYKSPTCGLFFMADDYIKFIYNLDYYLSISKFKEININESKYKNYLKKIQYNGLIGKLDDIEIFFLHYKNFDDAVNKWNRRKLRINKDNIIFKFNDQNLCDYSHLELFDNFPAKNKICFTSKHYEDIETIQLKKFKNYSQVLSDTKESDYKKEFSIVKYINQRL